MHNLAMELAVQGHIVSGSDDEIYDPAYSRLKNAGLLPSQVGWNSDQITREIDLVILGMHARQDNPELVRAKNLDLEIMSFPEFIGRFSKAQKRVVVAGSHGKSTTTAMIMHVLKKLNIKADYLLGGILPGIDRMVNLSGSDILVVEGDEYLSSRIDPTPKMLHYNGNIVVITGIEWDHMNVFPTYDDYTSQFANLIDSVNRSGGKIFWYKKDKQSEELINKSKSLRHLSYGALDQDENLNIKFQKAIYPVKIFGKHNMANLNAARQVCNELGIGDDDFFQAITDFVGVKRRLELVTQDPRIFLDYAHAPSKVKATVKAVKEQFPDDKILAIYELHTYSSLNKDFIPNYKHTLENADEAIIFIDEHALKMKRMPSLDPKLVRKSFDHKNITILSDRVDLKKHFDDAKSIFDTILLMSSGTFGGLKIT